MTQCVLHVKDEGGQDVARVLHSIDGMTSWVETVGPVVQLSAIGEGRHASQLKVRCFIVRHSFQVGAYPAVVVHLLCRVWMRLAIYPPYHASTFRGLLTHLGLC